MYAGGARIAGAVCELVYLVASSAADPTVLAAIAQRHRLQCTPSDDRKIGRALAHERLYATFEQCSCGTALGWRPVATDAPGTEHDVRDLVRRGWGEAKIARWKAQREAARAPAAPDDRPSPEASGPLASS